MPLSPSDVHNVAFSKSQIGKRGYNEEEVDAFLDLVEAELARLINENNDLHSRIDQLNKRLHATQSGTVSNVRPLVAATRPTRPQAAAGDDQHAQTAKVLGMAQEIADRLTGDAKAEADRTLNQARTAAVQLLSETQAKVDGMISEARSRAQTMLNDARTRAEALERESREKAAALDRETTRKHTEALGAISQEKLALEKKVAELTTFEREYRSRLKKYLNLQLRELDGPAATAPESGAHHAEPTTAVPLRHAG